MAKSKVQQICSIKPTQKGWFSRLNPEQQKLAEEVRKEVMSKGLPMSPVAKNLIEELQLTVTAQSVVGWFREASK